MFNINKIQSIIKDMVIAQPIIDGIALMSKDGLIIQSALEYANEDLIAAAGAILYHLGVNSTQALKKGKMQIMFIKGKDGYLVVSEINDEIVLLISTNYSNIQIGTLMFEVKETNEKLKSVLKYKMGL
ncbi:MAG: roadblock/LC7 domain-containing protein [Candidatus Helarchaeota archaeon]